MADMVDPDGSGAVWSWDRPIPADVTRERQADPRTHWWERLLRRRP